MKQYPALENEQGAWFLDQKWQNWFKNKEKSFNLRSLGFKIS